MDRAASCRNHVVAARDENEGERESYDAHRDGISLRGRARVVEKLWVIGLPLVF